MPNAFAERPTKPNPFVVLVESYSTNMVMPPTPAKPVRSMGTTTSVPGVVYKVAMVAVL